MLPPPQVKPYTLGDIGLEEDSSDTGSQVTRELPLISQGERNAMEATISEFANLGLMTKEYWENSAKESMNMLAEEGLSSDQIGEIANKIVEGNPIPTRARASREEVTRRETAKAEEYFGLLREKLPILTESQLILLRQNITVNLAIIRLQRDYNHPEGIPDELLLNMRDRYITFRKEVTKEMEKRGMKSI